MASFDPLYASTQAKAMADMQVSASRGLISARKEKISQSRTALNTLQNSLQTFQNKIKDIAKPGMVLMQTTSFSKDGVAQANVKSSAQTGSYSFFVEQTASAHQLSLATAHAMPAQGGSFAVLLEDGTRIQVDLGRADGDNNGEVSVAELARTINTAANNQGKLRASVMTVNGNPQLILSSGVSGEVGKISFDTSSLTDTSLQNSIGNARQMVAARNAVFYLGDQTTGTRIEQSSNVFNGIEGVELTFSQAMRTGDAPLVFSVTMDHSNTQAKLQQFVDAYNDLHKQLNNLTASGGQNAVAGPFSGDAGLRSLQSRMGSLLRDTMDSVRLSDYGVSADRFGNLSLDSTKFKNGLDKNPEGLERLLGGQGGVGQKMSDYVQSWLSLTGGQLKQRKTSLEKMEKTISDQESSLNQTYERAVQRYTKQFQKVQNLQGQMDQTLDLFESIFNSNAKK